MVKRNADVKDAQASEAEAAAKIGDNNPPAGPPLDEIDPRKLIDPEIISPLLELNFRDLSDLRDERLEGIQRWVEAHSEQQKDGSRSKPVIVSDEDCGLTLDFLKGQLRKFKGLTDDAKKKIKGPIDEAGKRVITFFDRNHADIVKEAMQPIEEAYTLFVVGKAERERKTREEAARQAEEEAKRLADIARMINLARQKEAAIQEAERAEDLATDLRIAAQAPVTELSRVRGDLNTVGGLTTTWHWRTEALLDLVQAVAAGRAPIDVLTTNDATLDKMAREEKAAAKLPGISFYPTQKGR